MPSCGFPGYWIPEVAKLCAVSQRGPEVAVRPPARNRVVLPWTIIEVLDTGRLEAVGPDG